MDKIAQKMRTRDWLREKVSPTGFIDKTFSTEFGQIMKQLVEKTDDPVRSLVAGEKLGTPTFPDGMDITVSLKDLIKSAKTNLNRREYMLAVEDLGKFHKIVEDVAVILNSFAPNINDIHSQFLFPEKGDRSVQNKKYLNEELGKRFANENHILIKHSGVMDTIHNYLTERGRAVKFWEQRFPKRVGKLRDELKSLLKSSESLLLSTILPELEKMSEFRAKRKIEDYILSSQKIIDKYQQYNSSFKKFYNEQVKGFLIEQKLIDDKAVEKKEEETKKEEKKQLRQVTYNEQQKTAPISPPIPGVQYTPKPVQTPDALKPEQSKSPVGPGFPEEDEDSGRPTLSNIPVQNYTDEEFEEAFNYVKKYDPNRYNKAVDYVEELNKLPNKEKALEVLNNNFMNWYRNLPNKITSEDLKGAQDEFVSDEDVEEEQPNFQGELDLSSKPKETKQVLVDPVRKTKSKSPAATKKQPVVEKSKTEKPAVERRPNQPEAIELFTKVEQPAELLTAPEQVIVEPVRKPSDVRFSKPPSTNEFSRLHGVDSDLSELVGKDFSNFISQTPKVQIQNPMLPAANIKRDEPIILQRRTKFVEPAALPPAQILRETPQAPTAEIGKPVPEAKRETSTQSKPAGNVPSLPGTFGPRPLGPPKPPPPKDEDKSNDKNYNVRAQNIINSLQKLSNESPQVLAMYIYKYAKMIEKSDKQTAEKLFDIVNQIKE